MIIKQNGFFILIQVEVLTNMMRTVLEPGYTKIEQMIQYIEMKCSTFCLTLVRVQLNFSREILRNKSLILAHLSPCQLMFTGNALTTAENHNITTQSHMFTFKISHNNGTVLVSVFIRLFLFKNPQ